MEKHETLRLKFDLILILYDALVSGFVKPSVQ